MREFTAAHVGLQNCYDNAAAAIKSAVKEIDDRERLKKEKDKANNKKVTGSKAAEEKPEEPGLPSLFTAPSTTPKAARANDATTSDSASAVEGDEGGNLGMLVMFYGKRWTKPRSVLLSRARTLTAG